MYLPIFKFETIFNSGHDIYRRFSDTLYGVGQPYGKGNVLREAQNNIVMI